MKLLMKEKQIKGSDLHLYEKICHNSIIILKLNYIFNCK